MPSCEEDVMRIGKKIERMNHGTKPMDGALELLDALSALPVDVDILSRTRIGVTVNELRKKTTDTVLAKKAKNLIKGWKKQLSAKNGSPSDELTRTDSSTSVASAHSEDSTPAIPQPKPQPVKEPPVAAVRSAAKELNPDAVRNKSAQMILDALKSAMIPSGALDPEGLAIRIEEKMFQVNRGTGNKYRAAVRSRVFNLRDKTNPALREKVLMGILDAEKFAIMTPHEMASDEVKKQREVYEQEGISEHQMAVQEGTPSDMFKCGKCGKNNCTYNQMQTRSADEPMTTFVFCRECGNRWKFC